MILDKTKHILEFVNSLNRSPKEVLATCIKETLDKSVEHYNQILQRAQEYLMSKDPVRLLDTIEHNKNEEEIL